jgi:hypothetical protein
MNGAWTAILLYGAVAGLEVSWFWAFLDLLKQKGVGGFLPLVSLLGFYPLSFVFHRLLSGFSCKKAIPSGGLVWAVLTFILGKVNFFPNSGWADPQWLKDFGNALAGAVHGLTPESLVVFSSAVFWGFGCRLAYGRVHFSTLVGEFQFGLAILLTLFLLNAQWELSMNALIPLSLAFFFFALSGIAVSHASERGSWVSGGYRDRWFAFLLLTIGLILGIGWLISVVINPSLIEFILSLLATAGQWVWGWIVKFFIFLSELIPPPKPVELPPGTRMGPIKGPTEEPFILFSDSVREVIRFIWGIGVLSLILAALWRVSSQVFEWLRRKMGGMRESEVEALPGAFREDLFNFLKKLLRIFGIRWLFRRGKRSEPLPVGVELVRKTYRQLSAWAAARGQGRKAAQTPYEYLPALLAWLPERGDDFTLITEQYVQTRYSPAIPGKAGLQELQRSWQRIRETRVKKQSKNSGKK